MATELLVACGASEPKRTGVGPNRVAELKAFRAYPVYWTGERFDGLPLSLAVHEKNQPNAKDSVRVHYGTCELPEGEGGCAEPVQIDIRPREGRVPRRASEVRGVPARVESDDEFGTIELHTGEVVVTITTGSAAQARRVAGRLVRLNGKSRRGADLPAPTR